MVPELFPSVFFFTEVSDLDTHTPTGFYFDVLIREHTQELGPDEVRCLAWCFSSIVVVHGMSSPLTTTGARINSQVGCPVCSGPDEVEVFEGEAEGAGFGLFEDDGIEGGEGEGHSEVDSASAIADALGFVTVDKDDGWDSA